ncbi:MAG: type II toxin-antitoxin system Phd/YefM family antitoxin [Gammaproteobacteria bacterium]|nr:type II toxin-antitoxin system Phd/YefM family antitoxin [Rhodocyclaceae bacterium]MBU3910343.1 type II toxin-antitoxin system Phd/YefM family antitoxin [Gammaproteobacteria bacterium]MBU3990273.1 type II toxin-antitoxin system Phd/YefM family antitoxin [Gammaproteobacteria bacterium]MBU4004170.1 type II toxin-antitoxin system Phd/YefM family antitoxin [Gammaproteobacteria bacterium]MBU4020417.1 type II toxin-antitoxin system Phd/YefM family antitoxin [Gammaproteobacteria bacterium]
MDRTCSIAEARNDLSGVVREAEAGRPVTLSRRGRPVAVIVSTRDYARVADSRRTVAEAIDEFRDRHAAALADENWLPERDQSPGRAPWQP